MESSMLKSLNLKNFQSHKDTHIEFADGVTAFYGTSHNGKSSIFRALSLFFTQRPKGARYIRRNQKEACQIAVEVDNIKALFKRTPTTGTYVLEGQEFTALQGNVPQEISNILPLNDLNISSQHDPFFLIMDTAGKAATKINSATHLEKADDLIKNISSELREVKQRAKIHQENIDKWEEELEKYQCVLRYEKQLKKALSFERRCLVLREDKSRLNSLLIALSHSTELIEKVIIPDIEALGDTIEKIIKLRDENQSKHRKLSALVKNIKHAEEVIDKIDSMVDVPCLEDIDETVKRQEWLSKRANMLDSFIYDVGVFEKGIKNISGDINRLQKELDKSLSGLDICDNCGQVLTEEAIEYMMEKS